MFLGKSFSSGPDEVRTGQPTKIALNSYIQTIVPVERDFHNYSGAPNVRKKTGSWGRYQKTEVDTKLPALAGC